MVIEYPARARDVLSSRARYKVLRGGRGSAKSWTFARYTLGRTAYARKRVLCVREIQNSIADSVHRLLRDQIERRPPHGLGLGNLFKITDNSIKGRYGSEFMFKGLRTNVDQIKSMEGIDICWGSEMQTASKHSIGILTPTIRNKDSEILFDYNPENEDDAVHQLYTLNQPSDCVNQEMNFYDNPWFPDVLRREMEHCKKTDFEQYEWVWLGKLKKYAHALIFRGKYRVEAFETPADAILRFGADWGFSGNPTCLVRMFVVGNTLYIDREFYDFHVELNDLPFRFDEVPRSRRHLIYGDCSRPETISLMQSAGFVIEGAKKWAGSVEDGISFLRSFDAIVIHPRCKGVRHDFENYRYKVDPRTKKPMSTPEKRNDHAPDAVRYGLHELIYTPEVQAEETVTERDVGIRRVKIGQDDGRQASPAEDREESQEADVGEEGVKIGDY